MLRLALGSVFMYLFSLTEHRHLTDTKIRLTDNTKNQVQLKELAISEDQNLKVEQIKQKVKGSKQFLYKE